MAAVIGAALVVLGWGVIGPVRDGTSRSGASGDGSGSGRAERAGPGEVAEFRGVLATAGRARAEAFESGSARPLAAAGAEGAPALREDLGLLRRLRDRGYRLTGVHYSIRGVRVLRRSGRTVEVAAEVTTSRHHQVRLRDRATVDVPRDGPRALVFRLVELRGRSGPDRWRIHDVRPGR